MIRVPGLLLLAALAQATASPPGWAIAGAPYRVALHPASAADAAEAGWEIRMPDFGGGRPDMRDVVLLGTDGKEIALDAIWRGTGRTLLVLAEALPGEGATLYFGGNSAVRLRSFAAKRSLMLEIRRLPSGADIFTFGGWQAAWSKSPAVDGVVFVPWIFHGGNPLGDADHFLSRYTGLLKTGGSGEIKFYTLSDAVSYITVDGRAALKWQGKQAPPLNPEKAPMAKVSVPKGLTPVEYDHAVIETPAAMAFGWERDGKFGTVPPDAWVHPGQVKVGDIESNDGAPVPLGTLESESYLGYGGEWYVRVKCSVAKPGDGWQAEWVWPDGKVDSGLEIRRLWMSLEPARVILRWRNGGRLIQGQRTLMIPQKMDEDSVNNDRQLEHFTELLDAENPAIMAEPLRKAGFVLAKDFLPPAKAARWAEAWLTVAKPASGLWSQAMTLAIREAAKHEPKVALERLLGLPAPARAALGRDADLLELDLRVFSLNDPMIVGLVEKLSKGGDRNLARMAQIRLGDYQLLNGHIEAAAKCFADAVPDHEATDRKAPVIDRSHSLALEDLVNGRHLDEAREKLDEWERQRPMARMEGDQLLWRARVMFLAEDWARALQDLETSLRIRPGSPEEIEVLFWQARALYELKRKDEARKIWNSLVKDYPKHERADAAKLWAAKP